MEEDNKRNLHYFESPTMKGLFTLMDDWQEANRKRLLSISIQQDAGNFCCIALTNPTEVIIKNFYGEECARVSNGCLNVRTY